MSMGVMDGEHVVVLSGPLRGREALITSVNRHKNLAFVGASRYVDEDSQQRWD